MPVYYIPWRRLTVSIVILFLFFAGIFATLGDFLSLTWPAFSGERLVPIYAVDTPEKKISISFDAAWGSERTPQLLAILEEYEIKTTFFLVKFWIEKYPEVTKRIAREGHEIGNHSATHPNMDTLTRGEIRRELEETNSLIEELTGQRPMVFRPPFGAYNNTLVEVVEELDMKAIQWSIDSLDWQDLSAQEITERVLKQVAPGAIVLFHNNAENTPAALVPILDELLADGYSIVPVSELIHWDDYYIDPHTGIQHSQTPADKESN